MDGFKMARLFLVLALAMTVASQPLETIGTSGGATLTTQLWNWAQVGLEALLELAKRFLDSNTEEEDITSGTKVLVATGYGSVGQITEIIDVEDSSFSCTLSQFPTRVYSATGGLVGDTPLICGGTIYSGYGERQFLKSCYSLKEDGSWKLESNLNTGRNSAANGEVIINNILVIAGGFDGNYLATIEVVAPNSRSETLPIRLPVAMSGSCIVPWDTNTFLIIGGSSGNSKQTYFIHMANNTYTTGPNLLTRRYDFACHTMQVNGEDLIIVAGGHGAEKSTEYLQKANYGSGWKKVWTCQFLSEIMILWLPKIIRSSTQLEITMEITTTRTSSNLHASTTSQTVPGPKYQPNFNI